MQQIVSGIKNTKVTMFLLLLVMLGQACPSIGLARSSKHFEFPIPTDFVPAKSETGTIQYVSIEAIERELRKYSPNLQGVYWNKQVPNYIVPHHRWFEELLAYYQKNLRLSGVKGKAETWDCENYSSLLSALSTVKVWKAGFYDTRAAIGWMKVDMQEEWAGLPAEMHALMFTVTEAGFLVVEPQNGQLVELSAYPNNAHILEVFLF